jgi:selenocysteine-specific elongation factor
MKSVIIGTAGHIDHGKSALVRALTGKDPDRLPEEKRRGITIDLGFADLQIQDVRLGFVDVPGHERFVKNMLAGAHGIDLVALVIAADEGVMPQTREHFDICRLLGVPNGLVVITKADLVEEELIALVTAEAEELVAGSFLEGAPIVTVSSKTQAGFEELKMTLRRLALQVPDRSSELVAMLPVDRAFTMKGFGPVVTGTLISGSVIDGQELELLPANLKVRARGLQVHGKSVPKAFAGQRTAVNLGSVEVSAIERGMVLAPAGRLQPVQILDVYLEVLPSAPRALRSRARIRLHLHTAEVLGRIRILDESGEIAPGGRGFAQLRLETSVVAHSDERFIIRSYSPSLTIAGGQVLNPFAVKYRGKDLARVRQTLTNLMEGDRVTQFVIFVAQAREHGQRLSDIAARTGWNDQLLAETARSANEAGAVIDCEGVFISRDEFEELSQIVMEQVMLHHKRDPLAKGLARETLRERVFAHIPPEVFRAILASLEVNGLLVAEKDVVRAKEHILELSGADLDLRNRLEQIYEKAGLEPPSLEAALQTAASGKADTNHVRKILQMLLDVGVITPIQPDMVFHRQALDELIKKLRAYADKHEPERSIDVTSFKDLAGVSRKYAIPLLEFLDRERITRRHADRRIILKPGR